MKRLITIFLIFLAVHINAQSSKDAKSIEGRHIREVMAEFNLDVFSEVAVGEFIIDDLDEIGMECLRRLNSIYSKEEINKLKENVPDGYVAPYISGKETLTKLLEFNENVFLPKTANQRKRINELLNSEEIENLVAIRKRYILDLYIYINGLKTEVVDNHELTEDQRTAKLETLSLKYKLNRATLTLDEVWGRDNQDKKYVLKLAEKYAGIFDPGVDLYKILKKEWFKISIAPYVNELSGSWSFYENSNQKQMSISFIYELLLIDSSL